MKTPKKYTKDATKISIKCIMKPYVKATTKIHDKQKNCRAVALMTKKSLLKSQNQAL